MIKSVSLLSAFQRLGLRALRLLKHAPQTYTDLADQLCICRRYAEQVIYQLRKSGFIIHSRTVHRKKYFWSNAELNFWPAVLTVEEKHAVEAVLTNQNLHLQTAFYKLVQLLK